MSKKIILGIVCLLTSICMISAAYAVPYGAHSVTYGFDPSGAAYYISVKYPQVVIPGETVTLLISWNLPVSEPERIITYGLTHFDGFGLATIEDTTRPTPGAAVTDYAVTYTVSDNARPEARYMWIVRVWNPANWSNRAILAGVVPDGSGGTVNMLGPNDTTLLLDVAGPAGPQGPAGPVGPQGPPGEITLDELDNAIEGHAHDKGSGSRATGPGFFIP